MFIKNYWLRSLSVIMAVALILTAVGSYLPPGQDISPFISSFVNASPEQQLKELEVADNQPSHSKPSQYMKFEPDTEDGKVSVIIGFTGKPARGVQRQAKLAQQKNLVESFSGEVGKGFKIINAVSARLPLKAVEALSRRHEVKYLEPDFKVSIIAQETPWGIDRVFGPEKYTFPTWGHSRGQGIAVAVLDTGIDENHIDLPKLLGGVNTVDDDDTSGDYSDGHGHGTHVAGTIAALDNNTGVVGVAPDVNLYAVKVMNNEGHGTYSSVISGIEWALNKNIPVINMSLGGKNHSNALKDAVDAAYAGGTLLVAAAGNDGDCTDNVLYPARYSSVIAVSASDREDKLASFSSRGPSVELIAPGVNILSLYPDNYMVRFSGTSMASPHVAGSAAVLWGADMSLSNAEVRQLLQQTAQDRGLPSEHQGYGLVRGDLAIQALLEQQTISNEDVNLSSLEIMGYSLTPDFNPEETNYKVYEVQNSGSVDVIATLENANANMTINLEPAISGEATTIELGPAGTATEIDIIITYGENIKIYNIVVNCYDPLVTSGMYRQNGEGSFVYWIMEGYSLYDEKDIENPPSAQIADIYCKGDGDHIIFWQVDNNNQYPYWIMENGEKVNEGYLSWHTDPGNPHIGSGWSIAAVHDITGNGQPDIIFHSEEAAGVSYVAYWELEEFVGQAANYLTWNGNIHNVQDWEVAAVTDLDYPNNVEVLWQRPDAGEYAYWKMDLDFNATSAGWLKYKGEVWDIEDWNIGSIIDLDCSGDAEIIWQRVANAEFAYWVMDGYNGLSSGWIGYVGVPKGKEWEIVGAHKIR